MKNLSNKKGFTLIELLAVIVILAIIVVILVPAVSNYLKEAREKTFAINANEIVEAVAGDVTLNGFKPDTNSSVMTYDKDKINSLLDKELTTSTYGYEYKFVKVRVTQTNNKYQYEICMIDNGNNGFGYTKSEVQDSSVKVGNAPADCESVTAEQ